MHRQIPAVQYRPVLNVLHRAGQPGQHCGQLTHAPHRIKLRAFVFGGRDQGGHQRAGVVFVGRQHPAQFGLDVGADPLRIAAADGEQLFDAPLVRVLAGQPGGLLARGNQERPLAGQGVGLIGRVTGWPRLEHHLHPQPIQFLEHRPRRGDRPELHPMKLEKDLAVGVGDHDVGDQLGLPRLRRQSGDADQDLIGEGGELAHVLHRGRNDRSLGCAS